MDKNRPGAPASRRGKRRSSRGETLSEVLVALLISAMGMLVFSGAVASTIKLIHAGEEKLENYGKANNALETYDADALELINGTLSGSSTCWSREGTVSLGGLDGSGEAVTFYCNGIGRIPIISYKKGGMS